MFSTIYFYTYGKKVTSPPPILTLLLWHILSSGLLQRTLVQILKFDPGGSLLKTSFAK